MAKPQRPKFPLTEKLEKYVKVGMVHRYPMVSEWDKRFYEMLPEDWSPCYPDNKVHVRFSSYYPSVYTNTPDPTEPIKYHVSVWGADDTGMEFFSDNRGEALWRYEAIGDGVTRDALTSTGFQYC
jgi:hypothetical protein